MSGLRFDDDAAQAHHDELHRTGVLSSDFRGRLIALLMAATQQAYERGKKAGLNARKKSSPTKGVKP